MKRFGLEMTDNTYNEFYRLFPDHGQRTSILRRCVHRLIRQAKIAGGVLPSDVDNTADNVYKEEVC